MISIAKPIIGQEEEQAILEVIGSGKLVQGPKVQEFEEHFAEACGAKYAIAVSSGTAALHLALLAHGIGPSDEVITSPFSFIASANCALYCGAKPIFVDIEPEYFTIDPSKIEACITPKTKAIIPVHLYGQYCDMDPIFEIAKKHNLVIIEDACQSIGASYKKNPVGVFGTACYSLYATKNIMTIEGGMIVTDDPVVSEQARLLRNHGSPRTYEHIMVGYNLRMTDLTAAIGLVQLKKLSERNSIRREYATFLTNNLSKLKGITTPKIRPNAEHVFHQYTIRITDRDSAAQKLKVQGIGVGIHYPTPIHKQPLYLKLGYTDSLPIAEAASREVLSLPVHPSLTKEDLGSIVKAVANL